MLTRFSAKVTMVLEVLASFLNRIGLAPNHVTLLGFLLSSLASALYFTGFPTLTHRVGAAVTLLMSGVLDATDGVMARKYSRPTTFGKVLDSFLDRAGESLVYSAIILGGLMDAVSGIAMLTVSLLISYLRSSAESAGVSLKGVGFLERAERIIIIVVSTLLGLLLYGAYLIIIAGTVTIVQRLWHIGRATGGSRTERN